jgi:hypothetical protein
MYKPLFFHMYSIYNIKQNLGSSYSARLVKNISLIYLYMFVPSNPVQYWRKKAH